MPAIIVTFSESCHLVRETRGSPRARTKGA
jgi:hypothetical protein